MFNGDKLNPVAWGTIDKKNRVVVFKQVPVNVVLCPVFYNYDEMVIIDCPFVACLDSKNQHDPLSTNSLGDTYDFEVENGTIKKGGNGKLKINYLPIRPNGGYISEMRLLRKYPSKKKLEKLYDKLIESFIIASNDERKNYDTLFILKNSPIAYLQEVELKNYTPYRYYRFLTRDKGSVNIAHMEFLGSYDRYHELTKPTPLPVLSEKDTLIKDSSSLWCIKGKPLPTGSNPEKAFDGDFETFVGSSGIGMDFNKPVVISHVRFIPRNANNVINVGDTYKLLYFDGTKWCEHGVQEAKFNFLLFNEVPSGTVYWLQNLTKGKEELPFFYREEKQYFINMLVD